MAKLFEQTKLQILAQKKSVIVARIEAEQRRLMATEKRAADKERFLIGAAIQTAVERDRETAALIREILQRIVTKPADRQFMTSRGWDLTAASPENPTT